MKEQTQKIIGQNLRSLRNSHGLTQDDMAEIIGNSRSLYTHYELGSRAQDTESLYTIASYFGIDMSSLFEPEIHDFLNIIANGINTAEQFSEITHIYNQLSPGICTRWWDRIWWAEMVVCSGKLKLDTKMWDVVH